MYTAGWNQPGYMPESTPERFDNFDDAQHEIIEELNHQGEAEPDLEGMTEAIDLVMETTGPFTILAPDGYAYWVVED